MKKITSVSLLGLMLMNSTSAATSVVDWRSEAPNSFVVVPKTLGGVVSRRSIGNKQGALLKDDSEASLAIDGTYGAFVVRKDGEICLTRQGQFSLNGEGKLTRDGFELLGWSSENKPTESTQGLQPIKINLNSKAWRQTSSIMLSGNISSNTAQIPFGKTFTKTSRVYDSMGNPHDLQFVFIRVQNCNEAICYEVTIKLDGAVVKRDGASGLIFNEENPMLVSFDPHGKLKMFDIGTSNARNTPPELWIQWNSVSADVAIQTAPEHMMLKWDWDEYAITAHFGGSEIKDVSQDGLPHGAYCGFRVDHTGVLSYVYDNGLIVPKYQIVLGDVTGYDYLEFVVGNAYKTTKDSGELRVGNPSEGRLGRVVQEVLEMPDELELKALTTLLLKYK